MAKLTVSFPIDHPSVAGHFPGNPIVPGAALLDGVLDAICRETGKPKAPVTIHAAKFLLPVRPGETVIIKWQEGASGDLRFEGLLTDGEKVLSGSFSWVHS